MDYFNNLLLYPYYIAGISAVFIACLVARFRSQLDLDAIPTVGHTGLGPISYYLGAIDYMFNANSLLQRGYDKYKNSAFKLVVINKWVVFVSNTQLIKDLHAAKDDQLSFIEAMNETLEVAYTMDIRVHENPYHIALIRSRLTRNIPIIFDAMRDEIIASFNDNISLRENEWTAVPALDTVQQIICRTINRIFVGLPLCRDPGYIDLVLQYASNVITRAILINIFPGILKPIIGNLLTSLPTDIKRGAKYLNPVVEERQRNKDQHGTDWTGKSEDMLSWLMDEAQGDEKSVENLTIRILVINFVAIHTTSMTLTHVLYNLAASPQLIQPMREEVEDAVREGWSKTALDKMVKIDSFLKETLRMNGVGLTITRKALKPFTFSNGLSVPKGSFISAPSTAIHYDPAYYGNPHEFDGFRFTEKEDCAPGIDVRNRMVAAQPEYIPFGLGKHACPGRFFAASLLKAILAHALVTYDIQLEHPEAGRPSNRWIMGACVPDGKARLMFRKRQT